MKHIRNISISITDADQRNMVTLRMVWSKPVPGTQSGDAIMRIRERDVHKELVLPTIIALLTNHGRG